MNAIDVILLAVIAAALVLAFRSARKRGRGSCCGGGRGCERCPGCGQPRKEKES